MYDKVGEKAVLTEKNIISFLEKTQNKQKLSLYIIMEKYVKRYKMLALFSQGSNSGGEERQHYELVCPLV